MKNIFIIILLQSHVIGFSQNNPIFNGGTGGGWSYNLLAQNGNNIFFGGIEDGWKSASAQVILPVQILSFTVQKTSGNGVLIKWESSSEVNSNYFVIERSNDGFNFVTIGQVPAIGNATAKNSYTFTDDKPFNGLNYYRIKEIDRDDHFSYTQIRFIIIDYTNLGLIRYFPNPASKVVNIAIPKELQSRDLIITLISDIGIVLRQTKIINSSSIISLDIQSYPKGNYFIRIKSDSFNSIQRMVLE